MIQDILTVLWKENKSLLLSQGSKRTILFTLVVPVLMFAVVLPIWAGQDLVEDAILTVAPAGILTMALVGIKIPDAIAGERERKTLETLLASRLPDEAILFGKVAIAVALGVGTTILTMLVALITLNIAHWEGRLMVFSAGRAATILAVSLLVAFLVAGLGVMISRRAETSQKATQTLLFALMVLPMFLQIALMFAFGAGEEGREIIRKAFALISSPTIVCSAFGVLAVVDVGLLWLAKVRFQRAALIAE